MKIERKNNRLETKGGFLTYAIEEYEITLDLVCVSTPRQGIGSALVNELKEIAFELNLPIGLYAEPITCGDILISEKNLIEFYKNLGFEIDADDVDCKLLIWK